MPVSVGDLGDDDVGQGGGGEGGGDGGYLDDLDELPLEEPPPPMTDEGIPILDDEDDEEEDTLDEVREGKRLLGRGPLEGNVGHGVHEKPVRALVPFCDTCVCFTFKIIASRPKSLLFICPLTSWPFKDFIILMFFLFSPKSKNLPSFFSLSLSISSNPTHFGVW